jgi:hypothetical protein
MITTRAEIQAGLKKLEDFMSDNMSWDDVKKFLKAHGKSPKNYTLEPTHHHNIIVPAREGESRQAELLARMYLATEAMKAGAEYVADINFDVQYFNETCMLTKAWGTYVIPKTKSTKAKKK